MAEGTPQEQKIGIARGLAEKLVAAMGNVGDVSIECEIVDYIAGVRNLDPDTGDWVAISHALAGRLAESIGKIEGPKDRAGLVYYTLMQLPEELRVSAIGYFIAPEFSALCPEGHLVPPRYFDSVGNVYVCKLCDKHYQASEMKVPKSKVDDPKFKLPDPPKANAAPEEVEQWFVKACSVIAEMLTEKRKAYGDNLSDTQRILQVLYPEGIPTSAYAEILVMVRIFDKFKRRANFHRNPEPWTDDENPWMDVAGYGVAILYDIMRGAIK